MTKAIFKIGKVNTDMPVRPGDIIQLKGEGFTCEVTNNEKEIKLLSEILMNNKISLIPLDQRTRIGIVFQNFEREIKEVQEKYEKVFRNVE